ncbi:HTH-type transcriptional repressor FabR [Solimonas sp. C16B3]|uniref:HTH-type transcriptional repressor FabR n=2 Tax=Solimonas marina TaxID=2714601 RepID=A0A969WDS1_9GAMM|nr:HTH-type transcriptional repressor FabR [Solimonas marina]
MKKTLRAATAGDLPGGARGARKQLTRERLLDAALTLMSAGNSFPGLSLREVTREAGVVPTAFYRHFRDMDELGLALVEECGLTLRRLLREVRKAGVPTTDIIRHSVAIYWQYVRAHPRHFRTAASERHGGSPTMRQAIRTEVEHFVREMAQDLRMLGYRADLPSSALEMICTLVVNTMLNAASDILDLPPDQPQLAREMEASFVAQIRLIFLGAAQWRADGGGAV